VDASPNAEGTFSRIRYRRSPSAVEHVLGHWGLRMSAGAHEANVDECGLPSWDSMSLRSTPWYESRRLAAWLSERYVAGGLLSTLIRSTLIGGA